jgi:probable rRNA maturation factor
MLEVEVFGTRRAPGAPPTAEVRRLCSAAAASAGVTEGHLAVEFVDAERIAQLNDRHRGRKGPTDVLSFPIDGAEAATTPAGGEDRRAPGEPHAGAPPELGDVVICAEHTVDLREAIVHGVLHLVGMDHETDGGRMLALQRELLDREAR